MTAKTTVADAEIVLTEAGPYRAAVTFARARIIDADVFGRGAPVPTVAPSPDKNSFLKAVADILTEVADETRFVLD
ncbi:hypothetical protein [Streptomyces avidinii]